MKRRMQAVLYASVLSASAHAATIVTSAPISPVPITSSAITAPVVLNSFNPSRGSLQSIDITVDLVASFNVLIVNTSPPLIPQLVQFSALAGPDYISVSGIPIAPQVLTVTSPPVIAFAPGVVPLTATAVGSATQSVPSPFFSTFVSTFNPFVLLQFSETGFVTSQSGLPIISSSSTVQGTVTVAYNFIPFLGSEPSADAPEPASFGLLFLGALGLGVAGWRYSYLKA